MTPPTLWMQSDRTPRTGVDHLGSGGEQSVFSCKEAPNIALGIPHQMSGELEDRIRFWQAWPPPIGIADSYARPLDLLVDASDQLAGYTMQLVEGEVLATFLCPSTRPANMTLLQMLHVMKSLAAAIHGAHSCIRCIGDLNCHNVMVRPDDTVVLLDCLSFFCVYQQTVFATKAGVPEYLPWELQQAFKGGDLRTEVRTIHGDSWSFAVLLFKALMDGFHPFANREMQPPEDAVVAKEWPYEVNGKLHPKSASPPLTILPPRLTEMFRKTFGPGMSDPTQRPPMIEWHSLIDDLITEEAKHSKKPAKSKATSWAKKAFNTNASVTTPVATPVPATAVPPPAAPVPMTLSVPIAMLVVVLVAAWFLIFDPMNPDWKPKATSRPTPRIWAQLRNIPVKEGEIQ